MGADHLRALAWARVPVVVWFLVDRPCVWRICGLRRERTVAWRPAALLHGLRHLVQVLVRVVPELAERVPVDRGDGVARGVFAPARIAGIKTGARGARRLRLRAA